jgi:hypothetical protein
MNDLTNRFVDGFFAQQSLIWIVIKYNQILDNKAKSPDRRCWDLLLVTSLMLGILNARIN